MNPAQAKLEALKKQERHHTHAETEYWLQQYKLFCEELVTAPAPRFPTMLRKMWTGQEVQEWIDTNLTQA